MKTRQRLFPSLLASAVLSTAAPAAAAPFDQWRYRHAVPVTEQGFIEIVVPVEALDVARQDAGDLRIVGPDGREVSYLRVTSESGQVAGAPRFKPTLLPRKTQIDLETPGERPVDAVILESPAERFLKAVRVEASDDGETWSLLAEGAPVFREANGAEQMRVSFEPTRAKLLRLTIDDSGSRGVPFSGARLHLAPDAPVETERAAVTIVERIETPGRTRLEVDFGTAHLSLASIGLDSDDPLFMRRIELTAPSLEGAEIREKRLAGGTVFRVAIDGAAPRSQLEVPIAAKTPAQRLTLVVENGDSPPLHVTGVRASWKVLRLRFLAKEAGEFTLFAGNPQAGLPNYDVTALARGLQDAEVTRYAVGPQVENPAFSAAARLPQIPLVGAALDTAVWAYRKPVAIATAGIQHLELDAQVLSRSGTRGADWRLMRAGNQVPYIVERSSLVRSLAPKVSELPVTKGPNVSRWELVLPYEGLPASSLVCRTDAPLFDRPVKLFEEVRDSYGQKAVRTLGQSQWMRTSKTDSLLKLPITVRPETSRWILEIENGDNAPIPLRDFALYHPAVRLLFKTEDAAGLDFYYGNRQSVPPSYDLGLASAQLLRASRSAATLGEEVALEAAGAGPLPLGGRPGAVFWIVLIGVVAGLLVLIARLLPKSSVTER